MDTTFTTRNEAIQSLIIDPIEANGTDIARADEYDIDAIADRIITSSTDDMGRTLYAQDTSIDDDEFWQIIADNAR